MTLAEYPAPAACPGCLALPAPRVDGAAVMTDHHVDLFLPMIHCAACIATVERSLSAHEDVAAARVNLGQKRVRIDLVRDLPPEELIDHLADVGIVAEVLDSDTLNAARDDAGRALLMRTAVAGFAMMNVMLLSVAIWSGAQDATRALFHWISALIALPTVAFAAQPFFLNAYAALRAGRLNMDVPISLAIALATAMSLSETMAGGAHAYFDAALSLTFFLLAGRYLDHRSRAAARSAAAHLSALEVPRVTRLTSAGQQTVPLREVTVGDLVLVRPGARVPVDGTVTEGRSDVDRSLLTGESLPVARGPGDGLSAGEVNLSGALTLRATAVGEATTLRRMATMIDAAESASNRYTALADRAARIYAPAVHVLAAAAFAGWLLASGDARLSLNIAIAVLIITCPCALGLAVPAVSTAAAGHLFRRGVLVKDGTALERLAEVDTVVFDKTGTLTDGQLRLADLAGIAPRDLSVLAALAAASSHPVARVIAVGLDPSDVTTATITQVREHPGEGIEARWNGSTVRLGSARWTGAAPRDLPGTYLRIADRAAVFVPLTSHLRPGARAAVAALKSAGIKVQVMSGDSAALTAGVAADLGIDTAMGDLSPQDKIARLHALAATGARVLMVGDGLNDTGALAAAWASAAPAKASDAARAASDVVLLGDSLAALPGLVGTARSARRRVIENFAIAAGYNAVAVPLALAGLATPLMAAIAMSASSIMVLLNALRIAPRRGALR
ncbi:heavy metal translocating P-type ATPase [Sulfitobacter sabulilitoris]|uniref:Cadmium-translocating P-type ATPase n=1 Tax=Sulfitobacter sabulilitoris TaxID=2562655 RepID=A0A5S3PII4_9RHOB|nr:heavy metal translocating P-type ATPase [Sulfitobacter sabulilitoris]TMM51775.1 cadmium-translocating P-type ATPase [Sulfitobacter sabulilitoris]